MVKQSDIGVKLTFQCMKTGTNLPVDFTGFTSVQLTTVLRGVKSVHACDVEDAKNGIASYYTGAGDLSVAGRMYMEVKVTYADGRVFRTKTIDIEIEPAL